MKMCFGANIIFSPTPGYVSTIARRNRIRKKVSQKVEEYSPESHYLTSFKPRMSSRCRRNAYSNWRKQAFSRNSIKECVPIPETSQSPFSIAISINVSAAKQFRNFSHFVSPLPSTVNTLSVFLEHSSMGGKKIRIRFY